MPMSDDESSVSLSANKNYLHVGLGMNTNRQDFFYFTRWNQLDASNGERYLILVPTDLLLVIRFARHRRGSLDNIALPLWFSK